jgi:uncharacterized metal-binding protein
MTSSYPQCGHCPYKNSDRLCMNRNGKAPDNCPTKHRESAVQHAVEEMHEPENLDFVRNAAIQEGEGYANKELGYEHVKPIKPRIQETIEFAKKMNFNRLGLVFCIGLAKEAKAVDHLLIDNGFEVASVCCKIGCRPKEQIGLNEQHKIQPGSFEAMCNPIAQALILNETGTEFNILMGLCVGHDSLMLKYAKAPCTVLAVKDRLLGHNPLAAIYTLESYYRSLK